MNVWKPLELAVTAAAKLAWPAFQAVNRQFAEGSFQPKWAPKPLLKSRQRTSPGFGWPRTTDSLCPVCVRDARARILSGEQSVETLVEEHVGEIRAHILERDGKVVIEKTCPTHGTFTDTLAIDPEFLRRMEGLFPGRDFPAVTDTLHNHGTSSIQHGRGAVLTVDLTNRCNMMCDPCFMDANQVGYVHELTIGEVRQLLDDALTVKPRRQMTVQFSGGEPTISPIFLDAVRYARQIGYFSVQAATNGIRFAQEPDFAREAQRAGMRIAYLQFDGVSEEANAHRKVGNLFDVKLRAIENLHAAGIDVCLVVTIVNTINNDQVGPIVKFALQNCDKISFVSFQPVSFTGRDEEISDAERHARRYTLSHLAARPQGADRRHRTAARLVPALGVGCIFGCHRPAPGPGCRLGHAEVRLPSRLRNQYRLHGEQEDEGVGAAVRVRQHRPRAEGRDGDRGCRARAVPDQGADRAQPSPQL